MNNKGFTLIELLAVIIILAMLVTLLSISVDKAIRNAKMKLSNVQIDTIENAANAYYLKEGINNSYNNREFKMCVDLEYLIENDYIEDEELLNLKNEEKLNGSVEITYESDNYSYKYKENVCNYQYEPINQICDAVTNKTKTTGNIPNGKYLPGDEYICEVKKNTKYHFFVLGTDGDNVNLIMDRNIYYDDENDVGGITSEQNKGLVEWYANAKDNSYGPVTAMNYLHNATKAWNNIPNMIMNYNDENMDYDTKQRGKSGYGAIKTTDYVTIITNKKQEETLKIENLKTRMPTYEEVQGTTKCLAIDEANGSCPLWLANYLTNSGYVAGDGLQNISGIDGYWTLSSNPDPYDTDTTGDDNYFYAWEVTLFGTLSYHLVDTNSIGVRPVISIPKLDIAD